MVCIVDSCKGSYILWPLLNIHSSGWHFISRLFYYYEQMSSYTRSIICRGLDFFFLLHNIKVLAMDSWKYIFFYWLSRKFTWNNPSSGPSCCLIVFLHTWSLGSSYELQHYKVRTDRGALLECPALYVSLWGSSFWWHFVLPVIIDCVPKPFSFIYKFGRSIPKEEGRSCYNIASSSQYYIAWQPTQQCVQDFCLVGDQ